MEFVGDGSNRGPDGLFIRNVAFDQNDVARIAIVAAFEPRSRQIDHADAPSGLQQLTRDRAADAVRGPGDDCNPDLGPRHDQAFGSTGRSSRAPHSDQEPS
jgi:hypothetical protein